MAYNPESGSVRIKTNGLLPQEIELEPDHIREQTLTPDLLHAIAIIAGFDGHHERIAQVDDTGKLMVNAGTTSLTNYDPHKNTYNSTTPSAANLTFGNSVSSIDLHIEDNPINIQLNITSSDTLGGVINLPVGDVNVPFTTDKMAIWCSVSGSTSTVQVIGWR